MQSISTYSAWDIALMNNHNNEVWYINNGVDYPRLGWQL